MNYILLFCQFALAGTMLLAATGKLLSSEQFLAALRLSALPEALVKPLALLTPLAELVLALGLLLAPARYLSIVMLTTVCLLSMFTIWMIVVYARGLRIQCGCFGSGQTRIGLATLLRNGLLLVLAIGGSQLAYITHSPLPAPSLWMVISVSTAALCLMLLAAFQHSKTALILSIAQLEQLQSQKSS
jgi:hypothetical protein